MEHSLSLPFIPYYNIHAREGKESVVACAMEFTEKNREKALLKLQIRAETFDILFGKTGK